MTHKREGKHFHTQWDDNHIFHKWKADGRQTISVKGCAIDEEEDGIKAKIFVKETSTLSTEARIL